MKALTLLVALATSPAVLDKRAVARLLQLTLRDDDRSGPVTPSRLPLSLLGTLVDHSSPCSAAFVLDGARARTVYRGDVIAGATVVSIEHKSLIVDHDGTLEEVRLHSAVAADATRALASEGVHVSYADVQRSLPQLLTQIRAVPVPNGLKVFAIAPDSRFARLGLKNGDVVHADLGLLQKLQPGTPLSVEIERDGRVFSLSGWLD